MKTYFVGLLFLSFFISSAFATEIVLETNDSFSAEFPLSLGFKPSGDIIFSLEQSNNFTKRWCVRGRDGRQFCANFSEAINFDFDKDPTFKPSSVIFFGKNPYGQPTNVAYHFMMRKKNGTSVADNYPRITMGVGAQRTSMAVKDSVDITEVGMHQITIGSPSQWDYQIPAVVTLTSRNGGLVCKNSGCNVTQDYIIETDGLQRKSSELPWSFPANKVISVGVLDYSNFNPGIYHDELTLTLSLE